MYCEAYSSFEGVSFDYIIFLTKIHLSLCRNKTQTIKASQYDWSSFTNSDIRNQYMVTVRNKSDTLEETSERHTPNDKYENFLSAQIEVAAKCILTTPRTKCRLYWEAIAIREKQDDMRKASLLNKRNPTNANVQELKKAKRELTLTKKNN